jgi:hypothetical protein
MSMNKGSDDARRSMNTGSCGARRSTDTGISDTSNDSDDAWNPSGRYLVAYK